MLLYTENLIKTKRHGHFNIQQQATKKQNSVQVGQNTWQLIPLGPIIKEM